MTYFYQYHTKYHEIGAKTMENQHIPRESLANLSRIPRDGEGWARDSREIGEGFARDTRKMTYFYQYHTKYHENCAKTMENQNIPRESLANPSRIPRESLALMRDSRGIGEGF